METKIWPLNVKCFSKFLMTKDWSLESIDLYLTSLKSVKIFQNILGNQNDFKFYYSELSNQILAFQAFVEVILKY